MEGNCSLIRPSHYGNGKTRYVAHKMLRESKRPNCCSCGESEKYLLVVHHIDGDSSNNDKSNLEIVCSNCHIKRHLKKTENGWIYDSKSLTPRDELEGL
jgi:5-methylcytosine-specific restriction endonuclease McrA